MARFYGEVGYGLTVEIPVGSGVWVDQMEEVSYYGDVIRSTRRLDPGEGLNSDIVVQNSISIVADEYALQHFATIKYVRWLEQNWTVSQVEVRHPRLILSLGEVYNGPTA